MTYTGSHEIGLGFGYGIVDYLIVALFLLYSPFLALDIIGFVLGGGPWGLRLFISLCKLPWREMIKAARSLAPEIIKVVRVAGWLYHVVRLLGDRRDRR